MMATKAELLEKVVLLSGQPAEDFKELKNAELEDLIKELEGGKTGLKRISVLNNKVTFEYYEQETDEVGFKSDRVDIVNDIIRMAKNEININSKPEPNEEQIERTRRSALARLCRVVIKIESVTNAETKNLLLDCKTNPTELYNHEAISTEVLQSIVNAYCEINNLVRF